MMCIVDTKIKNEINASFINEGYESWRRDRKEKGGGGVLILVRDNIRVEEVSYGEGMMEIMGITIKTGEMKKRKIIVTYVPPKTNAWKVEEHREMQKEVIKCLDNMLRGEERILLVGDFNCRNVNWKDMEVVGNAGSWSEEMLYLAMVNTLDQWVEEPTRYRGEEEPSLLDLVFTRKPEPLPKIQYQSPMGKSDHLLVEIEMQEWKLQRCMEDYKKERLNYARANYEHLRQFFENIDWKNNMKDKTVQEKYEVFLQKYNEGVKRFVPTYRVRKRTQTWYNGRCIEAKKKKR